jgi:type II secretion system protein J
MNPRHGLRAVGCPAGASRVVLLAHRSRAGFTLMEVLVATVASALLLAGVFGIFSRTLRLRESATERTRETRLEVRALSMIRQDLQQALVTGGRLAAVLQGGAESGDSRFPGFLRLTSTSGVWDTNQLTGDLQEVEYYVAEDLWSTNQSAGQLMRSVDRYLLAPVRQVTREEVVLRGVVSMEVEFLDGENWMTSWDYTDAESPLPGAVRVRLQRAASDLRYREPAPLEVLVRWPTQPVATANATTNSATGPEGPGEPGEPTGNPGQQPGPPGGASGGGGGGARP